MEGNKEGAKTCNLITDFSDKDMSTNPKDEVDPITIMLYTLHQSLSEEEIKTLSAVADVPRDVREYISDGLDLFCYLNDQDKLHYEYLAMLISSIKRQDLLGQIKRFYGTEVNSSSYAYTMEHIHKTGSAKPDSRLLIEEFQRTGEVPVIPRTNFATVEVTSKHSHDIYIHCTESDREWVRPILEQLKFCGITIVCEEFSTVWAAQDPKCRYCLAVISKAYISEGLDKQLLTILEGEIDPSASLQYIIPLLKDITTDYIVEEANALSPLIPYCYLAGQGEAAKRVLTIAKQGLKTTIRSREKHSEAPVMITCNTKDYNGRHQRFEVFLSHGDWFTVSRSDSSNLFRGDKGIKGLRDSNVTGHCMFSVSPHGSNVSMTSVGHPLTFIHVECDPILLPLGTSTLLLGSEWISIAGRRNAQQCQAKIKIKYSSIDGRIALKVIAPRVREDVYFSSSVNIGSGEGSNLKIQVPGVEIARQHCKIYPTPEGWSLRALSTASELFLQLPREPCKAMLLPAATKVLLGTSTSVKLSIPDTEDEGVGMSETCSRVSEYVKDECLLDIQSVEA